MAERKCKGSWLQTLAKLVEDTEAPDTYWLWGGLFTIASALERKVHLPYGLNKLWPNLYVIFVSPPGRCRKGAPVGLARSLLNACKITTPADSTSKEALTMEIAANMKQIAYKNMIETQSPMAVVSGEFSSLLSIDAKKMIEFLTDIYDYTGDTWEYKTKHGSKEKMYGPCVSLLAATTPSWIADNIPYSQFGAGFFARVNFIVGRNKKKRVPRPHIGDEDQELLKDLLHDLNIISHLKGVFAWDEEAGKIFDQWYMELDKKYDEISDERFYGFIERCHVQVIKVAMAIRVSYSNDLTLTANDIGQAIDLIEGIFPTLSGAFGGLGRSLDSPDVYSVLMQVRQYGHVSFSELARLNWNNINQDTLTRVVDQLETMECVKKDNYKGRDFTVHWIGEDKIGSILAKENDKGCKDIKGN